jgi:bacterioferritin-associated ferredoxin
MKLCVCKNISLEQFQKTAFNKSFEEATKHLELGSMCATCIHQALYEYNLLKKKK